VLPSLSREVSTIIASFQGVQQAELQAHRERAEQGLPRAALPHTNRERNGGNNAGGMQVGHGHVIVFQRPCQ